MGNLLQTIQKSGVLGEEDLASFNAIMEMAKMDFNIFSAKADQLEETKKKYNKQLNEMDQLHAQMKETEATLAEERDYIARTQQECKTAINDLKNCQLDIGDIEYERKGWEDHTSRFVMDLKLCDDLIQEEKKKVRDCNKQKTSENKEVMDKHKKIIADIMERHEMEKTNLNKKISNLEVEKKNLENQIISSSAMDGTKNIDLDDERILDMKEEMEKTFNVERQKYIQQISDLHAQLDTGYDNANTGSDHFDAVIKRKDERIKHLREDSLRLESKINTVEDNCRGVVSELEKENEKLQRVGPDADLVEKLQTKVKTLGGNLQSCNVIKDVTEERYAELKEINTGTSRSMSHWNQKYIQCNRNLTKLQDKIQSVHDENSKLSIENEKLKAGVSLKFQSCKTKLTAAEHEVSVLKDNKLKLHDTLRVLKDELNTLAKENNKIKSECTNDRAQEEKLETLGKNLDKCNADLDSQQMHMKNIEITQEKRESEMKTVIDERDFARNAESTFRTTCKKSLTEKIHLLEDEKLKYDKIEQTLENCENDKKKSVSHTSDEMSSLKRRFKTLESEKKLVDEKHTRYRALSNECGIDKRICERKLDVITTSLEARDATIKIISHNCSTLANCEYDLEMVTKHYNKSLEDCKCIPIEEENEDGEVEIVGFKSEITCEESNELTDDIIKELKIANEKCENEIDETEKTHSKTEMKYKKCQLDLVKAISDNKILEGKNKRIKKDLKDKSEENGRIKAMEKGGESIQDSLANCKATNKILREKSNNCKKLFDELEMEHDELTDSFEQFEKELDNCKSEKSKLEYKTRGFKVMVEKKEEEIKECKAYMAENVSSINSGFLQLIGHYNYNFSLASTVFGFDEWSYTGWYFILFAITTALLATYNAYQYIVNTRNETSKEPGGTKGTYKTSREMRKESKKRR